MPYKCLFETKEGQSLESELTLFWPLRVAHFQLSKDCLAYICLTNNIRLTKFIHASHLIFKQMRWGKEIWSTLSKFYVISELLLRCQYTPQMSKYWKSHLNLNFMAPLYVNNIFICVIQFTQLPEINTIIPVGEVWIGCTLPTGS